MEVQLKLVYAEMEHVNALNWHVLRAPVQESVYYLRAVLFDLVIFTC